MPDKNSPVTIYHNPACGTSRNTLELIRQAGIETVVIEYLKTPPDRAALEALVRKMGIGVRDLLREKGMPYAELGLGAAHPILINRPIVLTPWGARLCRPSDAVQGILAPPR